MADQKLKLALIGCGGMAGGHLRSYLRIKEMEPDLFDLAACCDPVVELAEKFADQAAPAQGSKPRVYTDTAQMLAAEKLDAADICCPHAFHHTNGIACLDAGVNVMIEKPFGITIRASQALIAAASASARRTGCCTTAR